MDNTQDRYKDQSQMYWYKHGTSGYEVYGNSNDYGVEHIATRKYESSARQLVDMLLWGFA